jgi:glycosyltransferase involved in cell wall biosynthesis
MANGILFIENHVAGGSDQVAKILIHRLPFSRLTVYVNSGHDPSVLLSDPLPPHVKLKHYALPTTAWLGTIAGSSRIPLVGPVLRVFNVLLRYPLITFSVVYFWFALRRERADILLANNGGYPGGNYCRTAVIAAALVPGVRAYQIVHSMAQPAPAMLAPFEWLIDRLTDKCCRLIAVSGAVAACLRRCRSIRQQPVVIYNGLPLAAAREYHAASDAPLRLLHVGYFDNNKNQQLLIQAIAEVLRHSGPCVRLQFVGREAESGYLERCKHLAAKLGVAPVVSFEGFKSDLESYYRVCDALVLCSRVEGLPMTILEAMRAGIPVIATPVGGIPEMLADGVTGLSIKENDASDLAAKIRRLIEDRTLVEKLGRQGRQRFEAGFTLEQMVNRYVDVLALRSPAA